MALLLDLEAALGAIGIDLEGAKKSKTKRGKMKNMKNTGSRSENGKLRSRMAYREMVIAAASGECGMAARTGEPKLEGGGGACVVRWPGFELECGALTAR